VTGGISSLTLLLFGAALVKLGASDDLLLYVRPVARPWVLLAGISLLLLAVWSIVAQVRATGRAAGEAPADHDGDCVSESDSDTHSDGAGVGHTHTHTHGAAPRTAWLVLAPVVAVLIIAPPALGEFTANHAPPVNAAATGRNAHLDAGSAPVDLPILVLILLSTDNPAALAGRQLTLVGFVQKQQSGGFTLARLIITCCAADASTGMVTVLSTAPSPSVGSWVQVTGTFAGVGTDANATPRLRASSVTAIAQPKNPYD
jgi:uncharacterized repeat protein (TIGR03943 family)